MANSSYDDDDDEQDEKSLEEQKARAKAATEKAVSMATRILALAGFTSEEYRIVLGVGHWYSGGIPGGRDRETFEYEQKVTATAAFARRGKDGVWEITRTGLENLLEGRSVGDYGREAFARAVLAEMGAAEKIPTIKSQLEAEGIWWW